MRARDRSLREGDAQKTSPAQGEVSLPISREAVTEGLWYNSPVPTAASVSFVGATLAVARRYERRTTHDWGESAPCPMRICPRFFSQAQMSL